jgi:hypothetical protein
MQNLNKLKIVFSYQNIDWIDVNHLKSMFLILDVDISYLRSEIVPIKQLDPATNDSKEEEEDEVFVSCEMVNSVEGNDSEKVFALISAKMRVDKIKFSKFPVNKL